MMGTLAPLIVEMLNGGKISIGPPWFEIAFMVPMIPLVALLGLGMHTAWRKQSTDPWIRTLRGPAIVAVVIGVVLPLLFYGRVSLLLVVGCAAAAWIVISSLIQPVRSWRRKKGTSAITRSALGMSIAHMGMGLFVIGVTIVSAFGVESDRAMRLGETLDVGGFDFELRDIRDVQGPNYSAIEGVVEIRRDGEFVATVRPQKRQYLVQKNWMTEAGIHPSWNKDLFVALGDQLGDGAWSVRIQYKPMISFIWIGAFIMALGGLISVTDRRYRKTAS
jgi:cytochrome c-type biogenesis protein CcmF